MNNISNNQYVYFDKVSNVVDFAPLWIAVAKQNWEQAERCLEASNCMYNYYPKSLKINPQATAIEIAIHHGNWNFALKILNKFPDALSQCVLFNQEPYKSQINLFCMQINPVDESLILEILQNKNFSIPSHFVSHLLISIKSGLNKSSFEFIQKIFDLKTDLSEKEIVNLAKLGFHTEIFKRYPKTDYEDLFYVSVEDLSQLLSLSKEYSFVKEMLEFNKKHLVEGWWELFFQEDKQGDPVAILKEILEIVPEFDIHGWTDSIMDMLDMVALTLTHQKTLEFFLALATQKNDNIYLEKYEGKIKEILLLDPSKSVSRFELLIHG